MENVNVSFAGCGFLGIYHVGVATCIKEYAPHLFLNKISGASIGGLAGCCLLTDVPMGTFTSEMLHIIYEVRRRTLGPFNPLVNVQAMLRNILVKQLCPNAYEICSGRLFISMTRVNDGANHIVSEYKSNEELINALLSSAFVPLFSGFIPPKFGEYRYIDGGFSNNLPILDENTITVSPFCGESDICPRDSSLQLFHVNLYNTSIEVSKPNIYRCARILFPPSPEVLSRMCKQGFDDALRFLQRNNMISCTKCLTIQRTILLPPRKERKHLDQSDTYDPECEECTSHQHKAAMSNLPENLVDYFEKSIDMTNKQFSNWIFKHRGMKIISIISVPYFLSADIVRAIVMKFLEAMPVVIENVQALVKQLLEALMTTISNMNRTGLLLASKIFGKLSVSVYIDGKGHVISRPKDIPSRNKSSIEFAFDPCEESEPFDKEIINEAECIKVHPSDAGVSDDTYEHILEVIDHHDSVMAFYYMDDSNHMNVVEIFDVTADSKEPLVTDESADIEGSVIATIVDKSDANEQENIESWTVGNDINLATSYVTPAVDDDGNSVCSTPDDLDDMEAESLNVSSDPESEWGRPNEVIIIEDKNPQTETKVRRKSSTRSAKIVIN